MHTQLSTEINRIRGVIDSRKKFTKCQVDLHFVIAFQLWVVIVYN